MNRNELHRQLQCLNNVSSLPNTGFVDLIEYSIDMFVFWEKIYNLSLTFFNIGKNLIKTMSAI